jgi:hypothetical protein
MGKTLEYGSGMNNPDHISESLETNFWVKILKFNDAGPGSGMEKFWSGIRDKHPGSATQVKADPNLLRIRIPPHEDKILKTLLVLLNRKCKCNSPSILYIPYITTKLQKYGHFQKLSMFC